MPATGLQRYTVTVGALSYTTWATGAAAAICDAITRFGVMGASARRAW